MNYANQKEKKRAVRDQKMKKGDAFIILRQTTANRRSFVFIIYHKAMPIAPIASGSHSVQPFLSSDAAEEVVEEMTSRTGFVVVTV